MTILEFLTLLNFEQDLLFLIENKALFSEKNKSPRELSETTISIGD